MNYKGVIIDESLSDRSVFKDVNILGQGISKVTEKSKTPWLNQWTLYDVEVPEAKADLVAERLSLAIEFEHQSSWYADFKNKDVHYIVFKGKIFKIDRTRKEDYDKAFTYGLSVGVPEYQLITFEGQKKKD